MGYDRLYCNFSCGLLTSIRRLVA